MVFQLGLGQLLRPVRALSTMTGRGPKHVTWPYPEQFITKAAGSMHRRACLDSVVRGARFGFSGLAGRTGDADSGMQLRASCEAESRLAISPQRSVSRASDYSRPVHYLGGSRSICGRSFSLLCVPGQLHSQAAFMHHAARIVPNRHIVVISLNYLRGRLPFQCASPIFNQRARFIAPWHSGATH